MNKFKKRIHLIFYHLVLLAMWATFSVPPLLQNNPLDFQAAGSIIVAYAIFNLSRTRANYDASYRDWITARVMGHLNRIDEQFRVSEARLNHTFDRHVFFLSQCCQRLEIPHNWSVTDKDMKNLAARLNEEEARESPFKNLSDKQETSNRIEREFQEFEKEFKP